MAYEKQTWECGDDITATGLNHIEQGLADVYQSIGAFIINATGNPPTLTGDKTYSELLNAIEQGLPCYIDWTSGENVMRFSLTACFKAQRVAEFARVVYYQSASLNVLQMAEDGTISFLA